MNDKKPVDKKPAEKTLRSPLVRVLRTHRRRRVVGAGVVAVLVATGIVALTVDNGSNSRPRRTTPLSLDGQVRVQSRLPGAVELVSNRSDVATANAAVTARVVHAEQALTTRLLATLGNARTNTSVSPLSLYVALSMLRTGAKGPTADEIATALQSSGLSSAEQDAGLAALTTELSDAATKDSITLQSANSVWAQQGFTLRSQYLAALSTFFRTGVWQTDFATSAAAEAINNWTSQQTRGKITKLFDHLDPSTALVLANAVFFQAAWQTPFDPNETRPGTFTTGAGGTSTVQYMSSRGPALSYVGNGVQATQLAYTGGRYAALAIMPTSGSLADLIAGLDPAKLDSVVGKLANHAAQLTLPRFTTSTYTDLVAALKSLGMKQAFTGNADLSGISATPTSVSQVVQRVYLGVGEKGTTAAAVTGIAIALSGRAANPTVLTFDHPFLFLIRDTVTGAVLFASTIADPNAG